MTNGNEAHYSHRGGLLGSEDCSTEEISWFTIMLIMVVCIFFQLAPELGQKARKLNCGLLVHSGLGVVRWVQGKEMNRKESRGLGTELSHWFTMYGEPGLGGKERLGGRCLTGSKRIHPGAGHWGKREGRLGMKVWKNSRSGPYAQGMWSEGCWLAF